jgi:hypothetical protein
MIAVCGCGRTGTNLVLEILTGSSILTPSPYPEDKLLFKRGIMYLHNYLTKCDTWYCPSFGLFGNFMRKNPHAKVIWTIRHPFDTAMSKVRRGYGHADDATIKGCRCDMFWMAYMFCEAKSEFPERVMLVKMENVIRNIEEETRKMCSFLDIPFEEQMVIPWERMRHSGKKERYGNVLDPSQINMYKDWKNAYNGFLTTIDFDMEDLFDKLETLLKTFEYEDER